MQVVECTSLTESGTFSKGQEDTDLCIKLHHKPIRITTKTSKIRKEIVFIFCGINLVYIKAVDAPSLEVFKARLDEALSNLVCFLLCREFSSSHHSGRVGSSNPHPGAL